MEALSCSRFKNRGLECFLVWNFLEIVFDKSIQVVWILLWVAALFFREWKQAFQVCLWIIGNSPNSCRFIRAWSVRKNITISADWVSNSLSIICNCSYWAFFLEKPLFHNIFFFKSLLILIMDISSCVYWSYRHIGAFYIKWTMVFSSGVRSFYRFLCLHFHLEASLDCGENLRAMHNFILLTFLHNRLFRDFEFLLMPRVKF